MFLEDSKVIGVRHNIIDDDFIHSLYDVANMVPPLDTLKRHLDYYFADKGPEFKSSSTALNI